MSDEIATDNSVVEATGIQQDSLKSFLEGQKDLVDTILREPTAEEKEIHRIKDIEARLVEIITNDNYADLIKFLEAYKRKTYKPDIIELAQIGGYYNSLALSSTHGLIYYNNRPQDKDFRSYELLEEDLEYPEKDKSGRAFKSTSSGEQKIVLEKDDEWMSERLGRHVFFKKGENRGKEGFLASELSRMRVISKDRDGNEQYQDLTVEMINDTLIKNLKVMGQEMQGIVPPDPSLVSASTPLTNPTS